jgi:hypothetical protein
MVSPRHLQSPIYMAPHSLPSSLLFTPHASLSHTHAFSLSNIYMWETEDQQLPSKAWQRRWSLPLSNSVSKFLADMSSAYNNCVFVFWCMLCYLFADSCFDAPDFALLANLYMLFFRNWLKGKSIVVEQEYIQRVSTHMLSCRNKSILYFTI